MYYNLRRTWETRGPLDPISGPKDSLTVNSSLVNYWFVPGGIKIRTAWYLCYHADRIVTLRCQLRLGLGPQAVIHLILSVKLATDATYTELWLNLGTVFQIGQVFGYSGC